MKRVSAGILVMLLALGARAAADDVWSAWPYRLNLHVTTPELADFTQVASITVNLGPQAAGDCADVRILDNKGREQPWRLLSAASSGDVTLLFSAVKDVRDYVLIFGNKKAKRPAYRWHWPKERVVIDDFLPKGTYIHGLWSWVKKPTISGVYAHTNPITDRFNYHGTSLLSNQWVHNPHSEPLRENSVINQYVLLDKEDPAEQIILRLVFEKQQGANSWDSKKHVNLSWGERKIKGLSGRTINMGKLPDLGKWQKLSVKMSEVLRRTDVRWQSGGVPELFGIEFCTDKGRATWDMTTISGGPAGASPDRKHASAVVEIVGLARDASAPPTLVYQRLHAFKLARSGRVLSAVRFFPTAGEKTRCRWEFGGGARSAQSSPVHVFEDTKTARVSLITTEPDGKVEAASADLRGLDAGARTLDFAIELVSCPFIVRADDKALFNLRLEGRLRKSVQVETLAVLLDANDSEIRVEREVVTMLPGDKHPAFKAFSLDVGEENLSRIRFEMRLAGGLLARRTVTLHSSRSVLTNLRLVGDRYLDRFGNPAVIRCELFEAPGERRPRRREALPRRTLIIGQVPTGEPPLEEHLKTAAASQGEKGEELAVTTWDVTGHPAWSLPFRQAIGLSADDIGDATDTVIVASATEMMLAGVPARTGTDAIAVLVDQIRRRSNAQVFLLTPAVYSGLQDLARQYTVALRMLGIEKNVHVIDVYSRAVRMRDVDPDLMGTAQVTDGVLVQQLHPHVVREITSAIVESLLNSPEVSSE